MQGAIPSAATVTCTWCGQYYEARPADGHCTNCGGPLPPPSGAPRGNAPPSAPRTLPAAYRREILWSANVFAILGTVFGLLGAVLGIVGAALGIAGLLVGGILGPIGILFFVLGLAFFLVGRTKARRQLAALELGAPAEGEIAGVELNHAVKINGKSPWVITYRFQAGGAQVDGTAQSFRMKEGDRRAGDHVWVVYLPNDPATSTLWPPVR